MKELTEARFRKWLRAVRGSRRFKKGDICNCPIAQYTKRDVGCALFGDGACERLPEWAIKFIARFDCSVGGTHLGKVGVLRVLDSITKGNT